MQEYQSLSHSRWNSIPPKFAVSNVVGFLKGKSAIAIARNFGGPGISRAKCFGREAILSRRSG